MKDKNIQKYWNLKNHRHSLGLNFQPRFCLFKDFALVDFFPFIWTFEDWHCFHLHFNNTLTDLFAILSVLMSLLELTVSKIMRSETKIRPAVTSHIVGLFPTDSPTRTSISISISISISRGHSILCDRQTQVQKDYSECWSVQ